MLDEIRYKQRVFPPGLWCGWDTTSSRYVFLPRTKVLAITGSVITPSPFTAGIFKPAQVLNVLNPDGTPTATTFTVVGVDSEINRLTLSGSPAVGTLLGDPTVITTKPNTDKLGVLSPNLPIDLDHNYYLGVHAGGTFYRGLMPYLDGELETKYPLIMYV
jgi:hypothetical protein